MPFVGNPNGIREWIPTCFVNENFSDELCEPGTPDHDDPLINGYRNYDNFWEWVQVEVDLDDPVNQNWSLTGSLKKARNRGFVKKATIPMEEENFSLIVIAILLGIYFII